MCWWRCEAVLTLPVGMQNGSAVLENNLAVSAKVNCTQYMTHSYLFLPSSTARYIPKRWKYSPYIKTCIQIFIATLFITARNWKQHKCPSVSEGINKLWHIHKIEYYSVIKRLNYWYINNLNGFQKYSICESDSRGLEVKGGGLTIKGTV